MIFRAAVNRCAAGTDPGSVSTTRLWKRLIAAWVCAPARVSSLRGSGMIAVPAAAPAVSN
jgi:hypothetical protein